jgi:hypothetical protein
MSAGQKIEIENVNQPGQVTRVDSGKYEAMKGALLEVLPTASPGLTAAEMLEGVIAYLPDDLFPQGAKAGWWMKGVQLDLEAKSVIVREPTKPLRWRKV